MAVHPNSMANLHHPGLLMDAAERLYARVLPPTPAHLEQVAGLLVGKPDAQLLLQMLGLAPYQSFRAPRNRNYKRERSNHQVHTHNANGYKSGCRCATCTVAIREYRETHRPAVIPHGTESGYKNGFCRCEPCRVAASAAAKQRREARRCQTLTSR